MNKHKPVLLSPSSEMESFGMPRCIDAGRETRWRCGQRFLRTIVGEGPVGLDGEDFAFRSIVGDGSLSVCDDSDALARILARLLLDVLFTIRITSYWRFYHH